jgi:hypothetical protein
MSTEALICPELNRRVGPVAPRGKVHALRYDDLSRVIIDFGQYLPASKKPTRARKSSNEEAELWVHLAVLRAENDQLREVVTDQLDHLAARVSELETRIRRPWWRRMFEHEPIERPRNRASERLKILYFGMAGTERRPT